MKLWLVLAMMAASGVQGWRMGHDAAEAKAAQLLSAAQADALRAAETARKAEVARLAAAAERDRLARELEDAAHADPDADAVALRPDSVRRLSLR